MNKDKESRGKWIEALYRKDPEGYVIKPATISADEARAMIDAVFRKVGLDPTQAADEYGWRRITLGDARGYIGVVPWKTGQDYLVAFAPLIQLPTDVELSEFYKKLLELNHHETLASRFSIDDDILFVSLVRPITGLDTEEVEAALGAMMITADHAERWLADTLDQIFGDAMVPVTSLPKIRLTPKEMQAVGAFLAGCDPNGREIINYLLERWQKSGNYIESKNLSIGLKAKYGDDRINLAAIRHGLGGESQMLVLAWESLRSLKGLPPDAIDRYQKDVKRVGELRITESSAHLDIDEHFSQNNARVLIKALIDLAKSIQQELADKPGAVTPSNIEATLNLCDKWVQQLFSDLYQGWETSGGIVQCPRVGRIYLKLQTGKHEFREFGQQSHKFNLAVLAAQKGKRGACIDLTWDLARGDYAYLDSIPKQVEQFEATVSKLPGFEQQGTIARLLVNEDFKPENAQQLLKAMQDLKDAEEALNLPD